jgi:DNA polymerase-3 subunit delta'
LPTIRSRTQRLDLRPLHEATLTQALAQLLPDANAKDRAHLVHLSEGSLGLALQLSSGEGLKLAGDADTLLAARGNPDYVALAALADRIARSADTLEHFGDFLTQAISRRIRERALQNQADERATALWEQIGALFERAGGLHLDPRQTVLSSAREIADIRRRGIL